MDRRVAKGGHHILRWYYYIRCYLAYINTAKGRYEWVSYVKAIVLWLVISLILIRIVKSL
ncbi:MAG: hypothetical protein EGQ89_03540 [Veillonella magna]|nr:hypothetical protein [Veillonella magna]